MSGDDGNFAKRPQRELTGRFVLFCFLGFFFVVGAVNFVLIRAATSTFGGLETENAYQAGLAFNNELAAARAQDSRHWKVTGSVNRNRRGEAVVEIEVADQAGAPPIGLVAIMRLAHPTDSRFDHAVAITEANNARFRGVADAAPGQWDLVVDLMRDGERVFRSKSRIMLR
jgi:nitrogen fixation protein FixH